MAKGKYYTPEFKEQAVKMVVGLDCTYDQLEARSERHFADCPNTLSNNAPQRSCQAGAVRDLGRLWPLGLGGRPRIPANETTNETAAES